MKGAFLTSSIKVNQDDRKQVSIIEEQDQLDQDVCTAIRTLLGNFAVSSRYGRVEMEHGGYQMLSRTSAPIGEVKLENVKDRPTNRPTDGQSALREVSLPIKAEISTDDVAM